MFLEEWAAQYAGARGVSAKYSEHLRLAARALGRTAGQPLQTGDLSASVVNRHLERLLERERSDSHRANQRRLLLTLWRHAARRGLAPPLPDMEDVASVRVRQQLVECWTVAEVRRLVDTAESGPGFCGGIPARLYWPSYFRAAWDTGLRGVDLRAVRIGAPAAQFAIVQHKTGRRIWLQLRPATLAAIETCVSAQPGRAMVWPLFGRIETWRKAARQIVRAAGLPGSIGRLRASSGTDVETHHPGWGHRHLGNSAAVFERHYLGAMPLNQPLPAEL